jgi:hypothetical protein
MSRRDVTRLTSLRPPVLGKHSMNAEFTISRSRARIAASKPLLFRIHLAISQRYDHRSWLNTSDDERLATASTLLRARLDHASGRGDGRPHYACMALRELPIRMGRYRR